MEYGQGVRQSTKIIAGDRRLTMHLMGLWQGVRHGANSCAPAEDFFAVLPEDLWADCCVVEMADDGSWEVSRMGGNIARRSGVPDAPIKIDDLPPRSLMATSVCEIADAKRTGAPILNEGETEDETGRSALFRSILLPLADNEGRIVQYLAGARCRVRREDA